MDRRQLLIGTGATVAAMGLAPFARAQGGMAIAGLLEQAKLAGMPLDAAMLEAGVRGRIMLRAASVTLRGTLGTVSGSGSSVATLRMSLVPVPAALH